MYARQVLEHMGNVKAHLVRPQTWEYLEGFLDDMRRKGDFKFEAVPKDGNSGEAFAQVMAKHMSVADAYLVDKDMMALVRWASLGLDEDDTFQHELWPSESGFMIFEEPIQAKDVWGENMVTKAVSWGRYSAVVGRTSINDADTEVSTPGTLVVWYTDLFDTRDDSTQRLYAQALERGGPEQARRTRNFMASVGQLQVNHIQFVRDNSEVGPQIVTLSQEDQDARVAFLDDLDPMTPASMVTNPNRALLALLHLLGQTVTSTHIERATHKAAARFYKRRLPSAITVITLRRLAGSARGSGESVVEWAHRWICRGHWRNQPYKGDVGPVYRKIWISPYIKNSQRTDLPFKQSEKVYHLAR